MRGEEDNDDIRGDDMNGFITEGRGQRAEGRRQEECPVPSARDRREHGSNTPTSLSCLL